MTTPRKKHSALAVLGGAVAAAAASSLCCIGPLLYLVFGVSAASLAGLSPWLSKTGRFQAPLAALSLALVGYGFWRLHFSPKPLCAGGLSRKTLRWLYWLALPVVLFFILYPFVLPRLYEVSE